MSPSSTQKLSPELAAVLPTNAKPWFKELRLLELNLAILSIMMFSSATGYDGSLMNGAWLGFISAIYWVCIGIISPIASFAAGKWRRKSVVYAGVITLTIATALQSASPIPATFIVARFFLGGATAYFGNSTPLLIAEVAHPTHRSIASAMYPSGFYVGSTVAAWAVFGCRNLVGHWAWRVPTILQPPPVERARRVLINRHAGGDTSSQLVEFEPVEMERTINAEAEAKGQASLAEMASARVNRHRLFITISLGFFSQWTGNGVVSYYLPLVLNTVDITSTTSQTLISACLQIWNLIFSAGASLLVDKLGRRVLFLLSLVVMFVSYIVITGLSGSFATTGSAGVGTAVVPFLLIYFAEYDLALAEALSKEIEYKDDAWAAGMRRHGASKLLGVMFIGSPYFFLLMDLCDRRRHLLRILCLRLLMRNTWVCVPRLSI
ncbi:sugar transporter [Leptodontidium sp. MPI-SDFR-AT-0119]|nr:sugar transporter [Leptodontidium sp. MPI-SDFR-AT-0119]